MLIWKPPAFMIIFGTFAVLFMGLEALLATFWVSCRPATAPAPAPLWLGG